MTARKRVENFAFQIGKPFTHRDVAALLELSYCQARRYCKILAQVQKIRVLRRPQGVYVYVWNNNRKPEEVLWKILKENPDSSLKRLAKLSELNEDTVIRWMYVFRAEKIVSYVIRKYRTHHYTATVDELPILNKECTYRKNYEQKSA